MGERGNRHALHVVGRHEVPAAERRLAARELEERERASRARADEDARALAGRRDELHDVAAHARVDVNLLDDALHLEQRRAVDDLPQLDLVGTPVEPPLEHLPLVVRRRVAEARPQHEAVELRLRERIGALVLDRVLGREDEERRLEAARRPVERDLSFLHRLQERRLGLRRGAVDLVREEQVREDGAGAKLELELSLVPDRRARHVARQQVGRELDAGEAQARDRGERPGGERLREARDVLEQDVPVGEQAGEDECQPVPLADDRALDLVEDVTRPRGEVGQVHASRSRPSTRCSIVSTDSPGAVLSAGAGRSGRRAPRRRDRRAPPRGPESGRGRRRAGRRDPRRAAAALDAAGSGRRKRCRGERYLALQGGERCGPGAAAWRLREGGVERGGSARHARPPTPPTATPMRWQARRRATRGRRATSARERRRARCRPRR